MTCDMDVATDRSASARAIRKGSQSHVFGWPMSSEGMEPERLDRRRTPTKKHLAALEMSEQVGDKVFGFSMNVAFA